MLTEPGPGSDFSQSFSVINSRTGEAQDGWSPVLLSTLNDLEITPDFYEIHIYPQGPGREDDSYVLYISEDLPNIIQNTRQLMNDYLGPSSKKTKVFVSELDTVSSKPGKQTRSITSALFLADATGQLIKEDAACMWWDVHNSEETANNNSPTLYGNESYGDYGLLASGTGNEPLNKRYPKFFAAKLLGMFANPKDKLVSSTVNDSGLSVHAALKANGKKLRLMVINKSKDREVTTQINLQGFDPAAKIKRRTYGKSEYDLGKGLSTDVIKLDPDLLEFTFPSYSITLLEFKKD